MDGIFVEETWVARSGAAYTYLFILCTAMLWQLFVFIFAVPDNPCLYVYAMANDLVADPQK